MATRSGEFLPGNAVATLATAPLLEAAASLGANDSLAAALPRESDSMAAAPHMVSDSVAAAPHMVSASLAAASRRVSDSVAMLGGSSKEALPSDTEEEALQEALAADLDLPPGQQTFKIDELNYVDTPPPTLKPSIKPTSRLSPRPPSPTPRRSLFPNVKEELFGPRTPKPKKTPAATAPKPEGYWKLLSAY